MDLLVKLSFYCFTAATIALAASAGCYVAFAVGSVRLRRTVLATSAGTTYSSSTAEFGPGAIGIGRYGTLLAWFGLVCQGLSIAFRSVVAGRLPLSNMFEYSLTFIFALVLIYVSFERFYGVRQLGAIVLPITVGMAGYIWSLPSWMREVDDLIPALQYNLMLTAHVASAVLAYACFAVAFAAAVLYLIASKRRVSWLPSTAMLDDIGYRAVTVGFPLMAMVLILGSVWAYRAWGTYWQWDPKETSALFMWLVYGVYLHTRGLRGWRGTRSAWILIFGFGATVFTYYGNYFFGGLHAYGGI